MSAANYLEIDLAQIQNLDISGNTTISGPLRMDSSLNLISDHSSTRISLRNTANNQYTNISLSGISYTGVLTPLSTNAITGNTSLSTPYTLTQNELSYLSGTTSNIQSQLDVKGFDASCVHLNGDETLNGTKTFVNAPTLSGGVRVGSGASLQTGGGIYFPGTTTNRKIVLYPVTTGECGNHSIGVNNSGNTFQFMVPDLSRNYLFSYGTSASASSNYVSIGSNGLNIQYGNLLIAGTDIFARTNTWSGANTFGTNNITISKSIAIGTATAQIDGGIYFPNQITNRKIVLWPGPNNEYQTYSIGVQPGTMQFMLDTNTSSYLFSCGASSSSQTDYARVSNSGINIISGSLTFNGTAFDSNLVHLTGNETIAGNKTFTGTTSGITATMVGLGNVNNTSDANKPISTATQTALNLRAFDASCVHLEGDETINGNKTLTGNLIVNSKTVTPTQVGYLSDFTSSSIKSYIDTSIANVGGGGGSGGGVNYLPLDNTWTGTNTFSTNHLLVSKSVGVGGYTPTSDGAIYFPQSFTNRKLVLYPSVNNEFQNFSVGVQSTTMQFMVDSTSSQFQFSAAASSSTKTDYATISNNGVNIITGNLLLNGTNILARTNTWTGSNTFSTNNLIISKSIGVGGTTSVDTDGAIYFPNTLTNRKLVLYRMSNNEFQNYSIGIQSGTIQFMVDVNTSGYTFSCAASSTSKTDFARIDSGGINIASGTLKIGGTDIFARTNTWSGVNTFTNNITVNSTNVTPTEISYLSGTTSNLQTQMNGKTTLAAVQSNNNTFSGTNTFSGMINTAGLVGENTASIGGVANAYTINYSSGGIFTIPTSIAITANSSLVITNIPTDTTKSYTITVGYYQTNSRFYINQVRVSDTAGTYISGTVSTFATPLYNGGAPSFSTTGQCLILQQFTIFSISTSRYVLSSISSFEA